MESALSEIEFLALSENRVAVLDALAEEPHTRSELAAETGASQATLSRILGDFEKRSWIDRNGEAYVATATGTLVARGFTDLLEIVETESELRPIVEYLPTDEMTFDLRRLADARITVPSGTRPNAPIQRLLTLLREADDVRAFSHALNEQSLSVVADRVDGDNQRFKVVLSRRAIDGLAGEPDLQADLQTLLRADGASIHVADEIPLAVTIADDVVHLLVRDETGVLRASIDTDDPVVRSWAIDAYEGYRETARPVDPIDVLG